jgi:hypothetical protein
MFSTAAGAARLHVLSLASRAHHRRLRRTGEQPRQQQVFPDVPPRSKNHVIKIDRVQAMAPFTFSPTA